jgi:adenylosuccinate lyase
LRRAGYCAAGSPFEDEALRLLWSRSLGIPRRLTTLGREAMEVAAEYARAIVRSSDVEAATKRVVPITLIPSVGTQTKTGKPRPWWLRWKNAS